MTVIGDLAAAYPSVKTNVADVIANTFAQAPKVNPTAGVAKVRAANGLFETSYEQSLLSKRQDDSAGFIDYYYDDNGWWALGVSPDSLLANHSRKLINIPVDSSLRRDRRTSLP